MIVRCLLAALGCLILSSPLCLGDDTTPAPQTLKVLTYNIHMWQPSVDELAAMIKKSEADIIGLNEAWSEAKNNQLAKALGYHVIFGGQNPKTESPRKPHWVNDHYMPQVLLTKLKVIESKVYNSMASREEKDARDFDPDVPIYRGGTFAVLETKAGNRVAVFSLHLHPWGGPDNPKMTDMRLAEIKGIVAKLKPYSKLPTLIIGDFNTISHRDATTGYKTTRYLEEQGFTDLFRTIKPDVKADPGISNSDGRIDYIFCNELAKPVDARLVEEGIFGSRGWKQSDHLAMYGEVKIGEK